MVPSDLVALIQLNNRELPSHLVRQAVRRVFAEITDTLAEGERVELRGFGTLEVRERTGGERRNPKTGMAIVVPERRTAHWRTGKALAARIQKMNAPRPS